LICDDHQLIREGLKRIVTEQGLKCNVGEASNSSEALEAVRRERWDVMILDINLGGRNGMEVLKEVTAGFSRLPVLMLSTYPEEQFALRAIRAGARGYLNKNLGTRMLVEAIGHLVAGRRYVSPKVAEELLKAVQEPEGRPRHTALSDREDQVLRLIGSGCTVGEIALRLVLSVKTVSTYRTIVLRKLSLKNNAQLMRYALEHGLIE
jgi:DNA-binding NarL/FixJ family response regulator